MTSTFKIQDLYTFQVHNLEQFAMFMIDPGGTLVSWNAGVERLFGYTEREWVGQDANLIFTPWEREVGVCRQEMQNTRTFGYSNNIRWHVRKDQSEFFANGVMNLVRDDKGEVLGYSKIVCDETDRKRLEDSLTESNRALEQFAYAASHDLQEPLRTMITFSELIQQKYASTLDPEANEYLSFIVNAGSRMKSLVTDLLEYARNATEVERPVSISLDEDLETALTELSQAIRESGAKVIHGALPVLPVDRSRMVRLFQNLVGNALKYRKPGEAPRVHVTAKLSGDEWIVSVRDNGIGFDPEFASAIFNPFKRLHNSDDYPGTGIGLAICSRIVKAHGGRIWAESQPGKGSTFFFSLPAKAD